LENIYHPSSRDFLRKKLGIIEYIKGATQSIYYIYLFGNSSVYKVDLDLNLVLTLKGIKSVIPIQNTGDFFAKEETNNDIFRLYDEE
jgi:hypothetical protein